MKRPEYVDFLLIASLPVIVFLSLLSGPIAELGFKDFLFKIFSVKATGEDFAARVIMVYHVAAAIVMAGTLYLAVKYVDHDEKLRKPLLNLVTAGWIITVLSALVFAYFWRSPLVHGVYLLGLSLMFTGAVLFTYAMSPVRISWKEKTLEKVAAFTTAVALLGGVLMGAMYASHLGFSKEAHIYIIEEYSTREYRGLVSPQTPLQLLVTAHAHAAVAIWSTAIMFIGLKWSRLSEWKPRLYRWALIFQIFGVAVMFFGTTVVPIWRSIAHEIIFVGIAPLNITLLILWLRLADILRNGGWRDPAKVGLFLVPIWMTLFVTSTGPIVASNLKTIRAVWPLRDEIAYNVAHWHMLSFVIASAMFFLYLDEFTNIVKDVSGWLLAFGGTLALAGTFVYELSPMFVMGSTDIAGASLSLKKAILPVMEVGLTASFAGFATFTLWLLYRWIKTK